MAAFVTCHSSLTFGIDLTVNPQRPKGSKTTPGQNSFFGLVRNKADHFDVFFKLFNPEKYDVRIPKCCSPGSAEIIYFLTPLITLKLI
jgi:hypothetical protein